MEDLIMITAVALATFSIRILKDKSFFNLSK